jgi:hypothetical protein
MTTEAKEKTIEREEETEFLDLDIDASEMITTQVLHITPKDKKIDDISLNIAYRGGRACKAGWKASNM